MAVKAYQSYSFVTSESPLMGVKVYFVKNKKRPYWNGWLKIELFGFHQI